MNGALPEIISYNNTPKLHTSTFSSCPLPKIISGDKYSGVPQNVFLIIPSGSSLAHPKSHSFASVPFSKIFSGFKSQCKITGF